MADYHIRINLDRSQQAAQAHAAVGDLARIEQKARDAARAIEQGHLRQGQTARQALDPAQQAIDAYYRKVLGVSDAHGKADKSMTSFGITAGLSFNLAQKGLQVFLDGLGAIGEAYKKAEEAQKRFTDKYLGIGEKARELFAIQGKKGTAQDVEELTQFMVRTGMKSDEAIAFQTAALNTGAQYVGTKITETESKQFLEGSAKLALARGLDPNVAGGLAGIMMGQTDWTKFGDQADQEALGRLNKSLAILSRGSGGNKQLADSLTKITAAAVSEDEKTGVYKSMDEAAVIVSTLAEAEPDATEVYERAARRGLRDFDNPLLKKAGVTPQMGAVEALRRLAPVVDAEAEVRGLKTQDVLHEAFKDERTSKALAVLLNRGVAGGIIADREAYGAQFTGPEPAQAMIADFFGGDIGQARTANAMKEAAEANRGQEGALARNLREEAEAQLIAEHAIDVFDPGAAMFDRTLGKIPQMLGAPDERERKVRERWQANMRARALQMGVDPRVVASLTEGGLSDFQQLGERTRTLGEITEGLGGTIGVRAPGGPGQGGDAQERAAAAAERSAAALERNAPKTMTKATPGGGRAAVQR